MTPPEQWSLRPGEPADLPALAEVYLAARHAAGPAMPPGAHTDDEVRAWYAAWDLAEREVWLAEDETSLLGFAQLTGDFLDALYVAPAGQRVGVGSALLDLVKVRRPDGFELWVFVSNEPARAFYARHGLVEVLRTDGTDNEEHAPDIRLRWSASDGRAAPSPAPTEQP